MHRILTLNWPPESFVLHPDSCRAKAAINRSLTGNMDTAVTTAWPRIVAVGIV